MRRFMYLIIILVLLLLLLIYIYTNQIISIHNNGIYEKTWEENGNLQLL